MKGTLRLLLTAVVAVVALVLLAHTVDIRAALYELRRAHVGWVLAAAAIHGANVAIKSVRWRLLLGREAADLTLSRLTGWLLIGQGINFLTPLRLGEVARATLAGQAGVSRAAAFGSLLLEKMLDMSLYVLGWLLVPLLLPLPRWLRDELRGFGPLLVLAAALLVLGGLRLISHLPGYQGRGMRFVREVQRWRANLTALRRNRARAALVGCTVGAWLTAISVNYAMLRAFDLHPPLATSLLLLVALQGGLTLPLVGMTVGPFEGICVLILSLFGIGATQALGFGLLLHILVMLPAAVGILLMSRQHLSPMRLREWLWAPP